MSVKTYRVKNMHEALMVIRRELGPEATLLETREVQTSRWFGLVRGERFLEVTATDQPENGTSEAPSSGLLESGLLESGFLKSESSKDEFQPDFSLDIASWADFPSLEEPQAPAEMLFSPGEFFRQLPSVESKSNPESQTPAQSQSQTPAQSRTPTQPQDTPFSGQARDALLQIFMKLCSLDMDETAARQLIARLKEDLRLYARVNPSVLDSGLEFLEQKLVDYLQHDIRVTGGLGILPGRRKTVALVGPTGVGKTTTIAKLAAFYRQQRRCKVGLITLDLYRMGAVEQLQTFADVIGIPMFVATTPKTMRDAMTRLADFDLVLIDTAGRSLKDEIPLQETRMFLDTAAVDEVHLVLASTARSRVLKQTAEKFACLGTNALIITKLDESLGLGNLYPLIQGCGLPVSYITNGQTVPDDFETALTERLTRWILGDEPLASAAPTQNAQWR